MFETQRVRYVTVERRDACTGCAPDEQNQESLGSAIVCYAVVHLRFGSVNKNMYVVFSRVAKVYFDCDSSCEISQVYIYRAHDIEFDPCCRFSLLAFLCVLDIL